MWSMGLLLLLGATPGRALDLVKAGRPVAAVVVPQAPAPEESAAASELARCLKKATGAELKVVAEGQAPAGPQVHVGATSAAKKAGLPPEKLDRDGLVLRVVGGSLFLCGKTPTATQFAVTRFLQDRCGCRWYIPTELGEHVPAMQDVLVPDSLNVVQEPSYLSRLWSSASNMDADWPRRNYIRSRFSFHHNLLHVFPATVYDQHPEFFPLLNGKRYRPTGPEEDHSWQPCFANVEAAKYAASVAARAFDADPSLVSFSLGINDSNGYCDCEACKALDDPKRPEFRGRPNRSNRVFHFMNNVARELARTHPDKYLGCLAYSWCEDVPSFPVDDHIIPYLTNDRAQWRDPKFRALDQELIRRWCAEQPIVGIYDYYYGSGYVIPRLFCRLSAESLKFARRTGVRAFYGEIYENWSLDGPKAWVASQLLWNTDQDVEALLADYYRNFLAESAVPMRRYFELCERCWVEQKGPGTWFRGFFDINQLELFPPDVSRKARAFLDEASAMARSDLVRRRVKLYSDGFRQTELYSSIYFSGRKLAQTHLQTKADLENGLRAAEEQVRSAGALKSYQAQVVAADPLQASPIPFTDRARFDPLAGVASFAMRATAWAADHGEWATVADFARRMSAAPDSDAAKLLRALVYVHDHPAAAVETAANGGMEDAPAGTPPPQGIDWSADAMPAGWGKWLRPGTPGELIWTTAKAHAGKASLRATGAVASCFIQTVPVKPGEQYACSVYVLGKTTDLNRTELFVQWQDAQGKWFTAPTVSDRLPPGDTSEWTRLQTFFTVPEGVARAVLCLTVYDQAKGDYVYFDDLSCLRLDVPSAGPTAETK